MSARLERILNKLAHKHAFHLLHNLPNDNSRLQVLADGLAKHGIVVMTGNMAQAEAEATVNKWVAAMGNLYNVLTDNLFLGLGTISATYADNQHPPVIVLEGEPAPVMQVLAGYVIPYVALKQHDKLISQAELRGIMSILVEELEGSNLPTVQINQMVAEGADILRHLLELPIQQVTLTSFARPLFQQLQQQGTPPPPPKPSSLPEPPPDEPFTETGQMFRVRIPLHPILGKNNADKPQRKPPVPLPPKRKNQ